MTRLISSALALFAAFALLAAPAIASPAVVISGGLCGMAGSGPNGELIFGGIGQISTSLGNDNKASLVCKGTNITNLSGRGQHFSGFACGVRDPQGGGVFLTTDTHATVSPSGQATLVCTFKK